MRTTNPMAQLEKGVNGYIFILSSLNLEPEKFTSWIHGKTNNFYGDSWSYRLVSHAKNKSNCIARIARIRRPRVHIYFGLFESRAREMKLTSWIHGKINNCCGNSTTNVQKTCSFRSTIFRLCFWFFRFFQMHSSTSGIRTKSNFQTLHIPSRISTSLGWRKPLEQQFCIFSIF